MGDHFFGTGSGHLPERADRIAQKHGACLVNHTEPDGRQRHWFACDNRGEPFDSNTARAVTADLEAAGILEKQSTAIHVRLSPQTLKKLQQRAKDETRPVSNMARVLIEEGLDRRQD